MEKKKENIILTEFRKVNSKDSLIDFLNKIYNDFSSLSKPEDKGKKHFTSKEVNFFLSNLKLPIGDEKHKLYISFEIDKKSGGKRLIHAPSDFNLDFKNLLRCIDFTIQSLSKPHANAFGFIKEKNIVENAKKHLNKKYVYNIDLKDFFHSFDLNRVKLSFYNEPFNLRGELEPIAFILASLVTCNIDTKRVLPQGSPSSPALTNHICYRLDRRLTGLAKRFGVDYSRYADDITFSSNHNIFKDEFLTELKRIIQLEGLRINPKKTRLQKRGERQEVTGLTVNEGVNVSKKYIKELRMYLYYCEKYGKERAQEIYYRDYKNLRKEGDLFIKPTKLEFILKGKLNFLSMVKGKDDTVYLKLAQRYNILFEKKTSIMEEVISTWTSLGIDAARDFYYNRKKDFVQSNIKLKDSDFGLDVLKFEDIISDQKNIKKEIFKPKENTIAIYFFKSKYGFQFKSKEQFELEYNHFLEKLVDSYLKSDQKLIEFMNLIAKEDHIIAKQFIMHLMNRNNYFMVFHDDLTIEAYEDFKQELKGNV